MKFENIDQIRQIDNKGDGDDEINLREIFEKYLYYWKWFAFGVFVAIFIAFVFSRYTPNQFSMSTTIFINDEETGGISNELSTFEDLGLLGGTKISIINEIGVLESRTLMERVVRKLELNVIFYGQGSVRNRELYGEEAPFKINFFTDDYSVLYNLDTSFIISAKSKSNFVLKTIDDFELKTRSFGTNFFTSYGEINIIPTNVDDIDIDEEIVVKIVTVKSVVDYYLKNIEIEPKTKNSSLLVISLEDKVKQKAKDILDELVIQYNEDAISYKNQITKSTDEFVNQRISDISENLTSVDKGVEEYKVQNKLTDIEYESNLILSSNSELGKQIVDLSSQIRLVDYIEEYIDSNEDDLIPANIGLADNATQSNTAIYNQLLLERNRIKQVSSELNPTIINLNAQISTLRQSIRQSLSNHKTSLEFSLRDLRNQENRLNSKRNVAPKQEREFQDIKRKQQIIESLYLYLLQKKEENAMSMGVPVPNAKIIDKANGSDIPVYPRRILVYLVALVLGILIPLIVISIISILNNKVNTVEDVERAIQVPILGDIPSSKFNKKIVIKDNERSNVAEAFRMLRTNLHYMFSGVQKNSKVIFISSTLANEGKTFIGINLSSVLASTNKKVLLIGADLRKPKITEYIEIDSKMGLTNFLADETLEVTDVINFNKEINFDFLPSGEVPPNPSNLLMNGRFEDVLDFGRRNYDFVIVDTAPVGLVTDTLLLSKHADLFIYVIRANFLDKRLLKIPKDLYESKRLPNMAVLLNDTNYKKSGYGYGYGYGV